MLIRYFAAAQAAVGVGQETLEFPDGSTLTDVINRLTELYPAAEAGGRPSLANIVARSSFLRNEVALRDFHMPLHPTDVIDMLPPFAGG